MGFMFIGPIARHRIPQIRFLYIGLVCLLFAFFGPFVVGTLFALR